MICNVFYIPMITLGTYGIVIFMMEKFFEYLDQWRDKQLSKIIDGDRTDIITEWNNRINS